MLTDLQRFDLFQKLRGPIQADATTNSVLDSCAESDLQEIEPVIEEIIQEERRAFFGLLLEMLNARDAASRKGME